METLIALWIKWRGIVEIKYRLYRCRFNDALSKPIVDNGLKNLWRSENPDSSEFNRYERSSGTRSRIDRVYTDTKIVSNTKINHIMVSFTDHYDAIFTDRLPSKTILGKYSWYCNNSLLCKLKFSSTSKIFLFLLKTQKTTTLQQVTGGKTLNLVLKKMLERFLKMLLFQKNIRISTPKRRLQNLYKKENFKPQIKPMIENLQDELYQLENKQAKTFLTMLQNFHQSTWKTDYAKSNNIWITFTDDINQNILLPLRTFSNLQKEIDEKKTTSKAATTEFLSKIPNRKKASNEDVARRKHL